MRRAWLVGVLVLWACGSSPDDVSLAPGKPRGGSGATRDGGPGAADSGTRDSGARDSGTRDSGSTDAGPDLNAPEVSIVAPETAEDPNEDTLVTDVSINVRCKVTRGSADSAAAVDKSSVRIALDPPQGAEEGTPPATPTVSALPDDEYQATFELGERPNGLLRFHCSARDVGSPQRESSTTLDSMLDLGPRIGITSPEAKSYALKRPVPIEFQVTPSPVGDGDEEHVLSTVKLLVAGIETPAEESKTTPGLYTASVDFNDTLLFPVPPTAAQIVVIATDSRTPTAATREVKVDIGIDGVGPQIRVLSPGNGQIVHGDVVLRVEVTDASGIKPATLEADINSGLQVIRVWEGTGPEFKQRFDTRRFGTRLTQLTINITARDAVDNETTIDLPLKLDNLPPVISLDPPNIVEWRNVSGNLECSEPYDPVGTSVPNDLESAGYRRYRALIEDRTNRALLNPGEQEPVHYLAGTNSGTAALFLQPDNTIPLLIDTDDNGICDEINLDALEMEQRPVRRALSPVNIGGTPYYKLRDKSIPAENIACRAGNGGDGVTMVSQPTPPTNICTLSDITRSPPGRIQSMPPALYAISPSNNGQSGECTGESWEFLSLVTDGWLCVAGRVEDTIGNIGISAPLRLCFDDPETPAHPVCDKSKAPTCTDGCTISIQQTFDDPEWNGKWGLF